MPRILRALTTSTCLLLLCVSGLVATEAPASAAWTTLCRGYTSCSQLGMSAAGYPAANSSMYWLMYSGHNCTNYAAYRMVKSGMPNLRPWSGSGNAMYWGTSNASITDSVPRVGAVAWWRANTWPAGSAGHVAYVEKVVSADEIIVSQDFWGGDFSWARITRGSGWPSGFVHFNDVPLDNTSAPAVTGTAKVGAVLTASPGAWSQTDAVYTYQWRAGNADIVGALAPTLRLSDAQQGKRISVVVTAAKTGFPTTTAESARTTVIQPGQISNTAQPRLSGDPRVDAVLTASPGAWSPAPTSLGFQWLADGVPVAGATAPTFVPGADQVGKVISVRATAAKSGYANVAAASAATTSVAPGTFTVTRTPAVTGHPRLGETLRLDTGTFRPERAEVTVTWLRDGRPVDGARGATYRLTDADLGSRVTASVGLNRPGYTPVTTRTTRPPLVRATPDLAVTLTPGARRLKVQVDVTADGVPRLEGTVRVSSRRALLGTVTVRRGTGATLLRDLPSGPMPLRLTFVKSDTVGGTTVQTGTVVD